MPRASDRAAGLAENADRANIRVYLGDTRLAVDYVSFPDAAGFLLVNAFCFNRLLPVRVGSWCLQRFTQAQETKMPTLSRVSIFTCPVLPG